MSDDDNWPKQIALRLPKPAALELKAMAERLGVPIAKLAGSIIIEVLIDDAMAEGRRIEVPGYGVQPTETPS